MILQADNTECEQMYQTHSQESICLLKYVIPSIIRYAFWVGIRDNTNAEKRTRYKAELMPTAFLIFRFFIMKFPQFD